MNTYNYIINQYNTEQILDEVKSLLGKKLYASYDGEVVDGGISVNDKDVSLIFFSPLNAQQEQELNNYIANYNYNSNYNNLLHFKINDSFDSPANLDYDIYGLHKKRTITFGELRRTDYYRNYNTNSQVYSDLVVEELRDYTRDVNGLVQFRTQTTNWFLKNGDVGATKVTTKYYTLPEAIHEGVERRSNVIAQAKAYTLANIGQLYSFDLLTGIKNEIQLFLDGYTQPLRDAVSANTKPYLTTQVKEGIIENLRMS
jgi:hypothetical protein